MNTNRLKLLYWHLLGWRRGCPTRNDAYLVQKRDGSYCIEEWMQGMMDWTQNPSYNVVWYRLPKGPLAQPPTILSYSPLALKEDGLPIPEFPRPRYAMQMEGSEAAL